MHTSSGQVSYQNLLSLWIERDTQLSYRGVQQSKPIKNSLVSIFRINADSITIRIVDFRSFEIVERKYAYQTGSEISHAKDFTIIKDSILVVLNYSRNKLIFYNLNSGLTNLGNIVLDNYQIKLFNYLKSVNDRLYVIFKASEFSDLKINQYSFVVDEIHFENLKEPKQSRILAIKDEVCLMYQINSWHRTWDINSKYIFYSNGCNGRIKMYDISAEKFENDIVIFDNPNFNYVSAELKKIGLKYKVSPTYKRLSEIDVFYFNQMNIYYINVTDNDLLVVFNDSIHNKSDSWDLDQNFDDFTRNLDYGIINLNDTNCNFEFVSYDAESKFTDNDKIHLEWNIDGLFIFKGNLYGWTPICRDMLAFHSKECDLRIREYKFMPNK